MKAGRWQAAAAPTTITEENQPLDRLYYVLHGDVAIEKAGGRFAIGPETFIGEVAFLLKRPATAKVTLGVGSRYVVWEIAALRRLMLRAPSLAIAVAAALNKDMAAKVARA
jgi:CRP-like cAMP-binding protein